jgi:AraC-like DNA-binding protein
MKETSRASLDLFINILRGLNMDAYVLSQSRLSTENLGYSLLRALFSVSEDELFQHLTSLLSTANVAHYTDEFQSQYICMELPEDYSETESPDYLIIGPYISFQVTQNFLLKISEQYGSSEDALSFFDKYYKNITYVKDDNLILSMVFSFADTVYGGSSNYTYQNISKKESQPADMIPMVTLQAEEESSLLDTAIIDRTYAAEQQLFDCVQHGQISKLTLLLADNSVGQFLWGNAERRVADPIRNTKNYMIVCNTLLRKAAEFGGVAPVFLHRISGDFAYRIESIHSPQEGVDLVQHMMRKYCRLVHNQSTKGYSQPVQKVISKINMDLKEDLTLQTLADMMNMNASYLSSLFKKEVGMPLTEYVNRKRVEYALSLLNTTSLQVQTIAQQCGIMDVNYFTKTFKKYIGMTPTRYRDSLGS